MMEDNTASQAYIEHNGMHQDDSKSGLLEIAQARHIDMMLTGFMERLFMREKLTGMQDSLTQVESMFMTILAHENNETCDMLVQQHIAA